MHTLRSMWNTAVRFLERSVYNSTMYIYICLHSVQCVSLSCSVAVCSSVAVRGSVWYCGRMWQCSNVAVSSVAGVGGWAILTPFGSIFLSGSHPRPQQIIFLSNSNCLHFLSDNASHPEHFTQESNWIWMWRVQASRESEGVQKKISLLLMVIGLLASLPDVN